jgi:hypothetical protein
MVEIETDKCNEYNWHCIFLNLTNELHEFRYWGFGNASVCKAKIEQLDQIPKWEKWFRIKIRVDEKAYKSPKITGGVILD